MKSVGSLEAKTNLSELLARVGKGERILITHHGKPAAMLVPAPQKEKKDLQQVIKDFKAYSKQKARTLGGVSIRQLIEEGRRF